MIDISKITEESFKNVVKDYMIFNLKQHENLVVQEGETNDNTW